MSDWEVGYYNAISSYLFIGYEVTGKYDSDTTKAALLNQLFPETPQLKAIMKKTTSFIRSCEHPETETKYCSECGSPMWIEDFSGKEELNDILFSGYNGVDFAEVDGNFYVGTKKLVAGDEMEEEAIIISLTKENKKLDKAKSLPGVDTELKVLFYTEIS